MAPAPAAERNAAGDRGLEGRQRAARDPARRRQLHADVEQRDRQHPDRAGDHQGDRRQHRRSAQGDRSIAPAIDNAQARTAASRSNFRRTVETFSAPMTAPMPKAPSMMP